MGSTNGGGGDMAWVGKRPARRLGGMADVLTMAADLGFPVPLVCFLSFPLSSLSPLALPIFHLTRCPVCCPPSLTHSSRTVASCLYPIFSARSSPLLPHSCNAHMRTRYTRTTDEVRVARWAGQPFVVSWN
jgi:hypothetical protein